MKRGLLSMRFLVPILLASVLVVTGCTKKVETTTTATSPTAPTSAIPTIPTTTVPGSAAAKPGLIIVLPTSGATPDSGDVPVFIQAQNFVIVPPEGRPNKQDEGHVHFYLDINPPTTPGRPAVPATGVYANVAGNGYTFSNVPDRQHTIYVQLVNNDSTPLNPPVVASVTINVGGSQPSVGIISPTNGTILPAGDVTVIANIQNFGVVAPGGANNPKQGHVHFYLDLVPPTTAGQQAHYDDPTKFAVAAASAWVFKDVAPGKHTIYVQLVNNDHTPLDKLAIDQVIIYVTNADGVIPIP